jgi:hypothetical protein
MWTSFPGVFSYPRLSAFIGGSIYSFSPVLLRAFFVSFVSWWLHFHAPLRPVIDRRLLLASLTKERGALRLDDPLDRSLLAAGAGLARFRVDAVFVLVTARFVECVAVCAVAEGGAFVTNRQFEDFQRGRGDRLPLGRFELAAGTLGVNAREVEDFRRIKVADAGDGPLVEQGDLHRSLRTAEPLAVEFGGHHERVGAEGIEAERLLELAFAQQADVAEAAAIPVDELLRSAAAELEPDAGVKRIERFVEEQESRHPWFEDDRVAPVEPEDDPLAGAGGAVDAGAFDAAAERGDAG